MGGLLDFTAYRMWSGGGELERLWLGGREWVRPIVVTVAGGVVTTFERDGVGFMQVLFRQSGSLHVSGPVEGARYALAGGGGLGVTPGAQPAAVAGRGRLCRSAIWRRVPMTLRSGRVVLDWPRPAPAIRVLPLA
ncbi:hypothetical protein QWZ10_02635 [Paracoccus cavernae]|uniref:Uncharacterized protein n=1 Tax=Paracoccus cavernae TaxID=1571207 RepID=A0ABT8D6F5_9RHOB|nr:hypothetical protein [Paracoccus cavernae]